ncbi:sigma-54 factor interaction domain-containing protein [Gemmatirosa kalamazoonensis]|uniref:Sigma-54 factor interaction domain-containing protein n=1 Tax=Gemmatirosa kalamazoonensis TaxID=861299 RepID=W0RLU6_9BACT|nr:sigma-54 dependent transcriptional regulator [Gemmatirosa kalamazoonensis]AHG90413.1 sigma-54 factor interaction domain-containing protein [Gemmatirosa kalamazoonensis]
MKQPKILIADDDVKARLPLSAILEAEGYTVESVDDGQKALDLLGDGSFGVVLADLKMPKVDGIALLKAMRERQIPTEFVMITGEGNTDIAVDAIKQGARDYIEKPLTAERLTKLKAQIPRLLEGFTLQQKNRELETRLEGLTHYGELIGQSEQMRAVYDMIERVAPSMASVLILGESGTGKELVARAIHKKSDRAKGPFYALNCAALPKEILENLLFGHEKGAFTGSVNEKAGAFEEASGGTIFLDEVAEMATDIQVKLLRALETRTVRRLGGKREIPVDIRIVAATNKDLQKAIADNDLREDLYYRLAVVEIDLPPLRDRGGDVQLIAREFLTRFAKDNGKKIDGFDEVALEWINAYAWPGNVRELRNAVEKAVILARGNRITIEEITSRRHRAFTGEFNAAVTLPVGASLAEARRQLVLRNFASSGGDLAKTAKVTGMNVADVRGELLAMIERRSGDGSSTEPGNDGGGGADGATPVTPPPAAAAHGAGANGSGAPEAPPVSMPPNVASPVGKSPKAPPVARSRKGS